MGSSITSSQPTLRVTPGESVTTELRIANTGTVVDQVTFQPLGDHAEWITVEPPMVRLFPDANEVVTLTISPPRDSSSTAGVSVWGVKALSQEEPDDSSVAEGTLDVAPFQDFAAELQPTTGRGRLSGRFEIAIDNNGNTPLPFRLSGADKDQLVGFTFSNPAIETEPGSANFCKLRIKPNKRIWRGPPKTHPFELLVEPQLRPVVGDALTPDIEPGATAESPEPIVPSQTVAGNYLQDRVVPNWFFKALAAVAVLLVALAVLWQTLVKPNVESAAREIALEEVEEVADEVETLEEEIEEVAEEAAEEVAELEEDIETGEVAPPDDGTGDEPGGDADDAGGDSSLGGTLNDTSQARTFRVTVPVVAGAQSSANGPTVAEGDIFAITDMVLQNPRNDSGEITISIGDQTLIITSLQSFRTLDFHTISPHVVPSSQAVTVTVRCDAGPIDPTPDCTSAVLFSGFTTTLPTADDTA